MYTRRLTADDINSAVSAERVNELADLSAVFDPTREVVVWSGSSESVDVSGFEVGFYRVSFAYNYPVETRSVMLHFSAGKFVMAAGDEFIFASHSDGNIVSASGDIFEIVRVG